MARKGKRPAQPAAPEDRPLRRAYLARVDERDDALFYASPRRTTYLDEPAAARLARLLADLLPARGPYLDLMAGWRSCFPAGAPHESIVGLGLNAREMAENPQLGAAVVCDLNRDPRLPFRDAGYEAVVCASSVQYLLHPLEVFREVGRCLQPGGVFVVAFSDRYFPTKATALWMAATAQERLQLVVYYFGGAGNWQDVQVSSSEASAADSLYVVWGAR